MIKKRILASISGNIFAQLSNIVIVIVGIPVLLKYWGIEYYGEWLLIFTIPGYIGMSEIGLGTTASTEMSILVEGGYRDKAQEILKNAFWLIILFGLLPVILLITSNFIFSWYDFLRLSIISKSDFDIVFVILILYVYLSLFLSLPLGYYRVEKVYHRERYISTFFRIFEFILFLGLVISGYKVIVAALAHILVRTCLFIYVIFDLSRSYKHFNIFPKNLDFSKIRTLIKPSLSTMVLSLGQNLLTQGTSTIIGINLGASTLVVFNTTRTLLNMTKQLFGIINLSFWAEFSFAFGKSDKSLLKNLYDRASRINLLLSVLSIIILFFTGSYFITYWTNGAVKAEPIFFNLYLVATLVSCVWATNLTLLSATNMHYQLARKFALIAVIITICSYYITEYHGLQGIAAILLITDILMLYYSRKYINLLIFPIKK